MADNRTRTALHAPTSKDWTMSIRYPFGKCPRKMWVVRLMTDLEVQVTKQMEVIQVSFIVNSILLGSDTYFT